MKKIVATVVALSAGAVFAGIETNKWIETSPVGTALTVANGWTATTEGQINAVVDGVLDINTKSGSLVYTNGTKSALNAAKVIVDFRIKLVASPTLSADFGEVRPQGSFGMKYVKENEVKTYSFAALRKPTAEGAYEYVDMKGIEMPANPESEIWNVRMVRNYAGELTNTVAYLVKTDAAPAYQQLTDANNVTNLPLVSANNYLREIRFRGTGKAYSFTAHAIIELDDGWVVVVNDSEIAAALEQDGFAGLETKLANKAKYDAFTAYMVNVGYQKPKDVPGGLKTYAYQSYLLGAGELFAAAPKVAIIAVGENKATPVENDWNFTVKVTEGSAEDAKAVAAASVKALVKTATSLDAEFTPPADEDITATYDGETKLVTVTVKFGDNVKGFLKVSE